MTQPLTPPQDITWTRMAFARDMIDTNFGDLAFGPKWRSSLAVYFYIVPEEETADAYPNSRIAYLKFTCSITGFNPSEELRAARTAAEDAGGLDDLQRTLWAVITSSGWAETYWPCEGAIMQIAVYPNSPGGVAPDDYPYFMDFEPKKREMFEQATAGSEFLSGSADKLSVTKGSSNTQSVDVGVSATIPVVGIGLGGGAEASWQQINNRTTDTSRESRETLSYSATFSQMYQLFTGYHLGTNRALFYVAPRPHTAGSTNEHPTDANLLHGERKLEGFQEVFLVVHMPRSLDGFCVQAGLDTGHMATASAPQHLVLVPLRGLGGTHGHRNPPPQPTPPPPAPPAPPVKQLVVTRRRAQACGTFDDNGNFHLRRLHEPPPPVVVGEIAVPSMQTTSMLRTAAEGGGIDGRLRLQVADNLNIMQADINRAMLDSESAASYTPRPFVESDVFKSLAADAASSIDQPLDALVDLGHLSSEALQQLERNRIRTIGELYAFPAVGTTLQEVQSIRMGIIDDLLSY